MRQQRLGDLAWAVYFIQDSRNNRVKIGSCDDPYVALETLQKGSSETLHLLASHEAAYKESAENIESTLHSLFQTHYTGYGWFEMVPSLEQYISLIQQEDYDKAEILLHPMENTQTKAAIAAASNATGYSAEQLKKYTQNSEESGISVTSKIKKAV
jgi:hypothetical protein